MRQSRHQNCCEIGEVTVIPTEPAMHFIFAGSNFSSETAALELGIPIFRDKDEWRKWEKLGDPVFHIEFRRWAGALVVAPLDANTLAKIVHGQCDNLLTCIIRAWDWTKPMFLCPAMNTMMWENKPTANQIREMSDRGAYIIKPTEKKLACNDVGMGAMAPVADIVRFVNDKLRWKFPLEKCNGIPINHHPGAFGFHRRKNHHTGVDLYCEDNDAVHAVEDGIIVKIGVFTGPKAGHDWWEETYGIMIEGASGVVNYGEVTPHIETIVAEGKRIQRGQFIGRVKRVLFPDKLRKDIPGHSTSMLHLELYKHGARDFADWHDPQKNPTLLDPTRFLMDAEGAPRITLTWDNDQNKTVG